MYISRINYIRQGDNSSYYKPVHLVTYYRYLRFLPDYRVASLLSSAEPQRAVDLLAHPDAPANGVMVGVYSWRHAPPPDADAVEADEGADGASPIPEKLDLDLRDASRPGVLFHCSLSMRQTHPGRHNKLAWLSYDVVTPPTSTPMPAGQLKPFFFSRVKSYV